MKSRAFFASFALLGSMLPAAEHDVVIYGGTCAAVTSAVR